MSLEEVLKLDLTNKSVLIIGKAGSGKTHLSNLLKEKGHYVIHTDETLVFSTEQRRLQEIMEEYRYCKPCVIEGMEGYALLLKGETAGMYRPDVIINCDISAGKQREVYLNERDPAKIKYQKKFYLKCLSLYQEWEKIVQNKPQIITYERDIV